MKVVISIDGSYELSRSAYRKIAELMGKEAHFNVFNYKTNSYDTDNTEDTACVLPMDTHANNLPKGVSKEEREKIFREHALPGFYRDRSSPLLVQVVEELGPTGSCVYGKLVIVEVPDDAHWYVTTDHNGYEEFVVEKHRLWKHAGPGKTLEIFKQSALDQGDY